MHKNTSINADRLYLPNEIWTIIAYYLPRMPDQPRWLSWRKYRTLNSIFKKEVEDFYIKEYLQHMCLMVDTEKFHTTSDRQYIPFKKDFFFSRFEGNESQTAVMASSEIALNIPHTPMIDASLETELSMFHEAGYHPFMIMRFANGLTDMMPMDIGWRYIQGNLCFRFNWRTYFCTLFYDLEYIDEWSDLLEIRSCVRLSGELDNHPSIDSESMTSPYAMSTLMEAARTTEIGHDGRLLMARRDRRYRLGVRSGQFPRHPFGGPTIFSRRFERLDEDRVIRKLHERQYEMNSASGRVVVEW
ncbi:hypothetical protein MW887_003625 [Aspergillus wentii]|nr:hypothetical protein MW887_003625 [Aspergillus wentii]